MADMYAHVFSGKKKNNKRCSLTAGYVQISNVRSTMQQTVCACDEMKNEKENVFCYTRVPGQETTVSVTLFFCSFSMGMREELFIPTVVAPFTATISSPHLHTWTHRYCGLITWWAQGKKRCESRLRRTSGARRSVQACLEQWFWWRKAAGRGSPRSPPQCWSPSCRC